MNAARAATVLGYLRRLGRVGETRASRDAELLTRYALQREDAAFAELVRRHGPMVLGVCRRVLGNLDDAEDAFQATFLVLAARPRAVRDPSSLANWLFGVARRTSLRLQVEAARRNRYERLSARSEVIEPVDDTSWRELRPLLDAEVARLPARYREAFILCCLEGRTHEEAAKVLGCPGGTVASRLSRARERLRGRLVRRGIALGAVTALFVATEAEAAVSSELIGVLGRAAAGRTATVISTASSISPRVAALTEGVLHAMWTTKIKLMATVTLALGVTGFGAGLIFTNAGQVGSAAPSSQRTSQDQDTGDKRESPREVAKPVDAKPVPPAKALVDAEKAKDREPKASERAAIHDAEDEVALAEARLNAKKAELEAAKAAADQAKADLSRAATLFERKAISQEDYNKARYALETANAQMRVREADVQEPLIRLRQARRRLETLRGAGETPAAKPAEPKEASPQAADARDTVELMEAQSKVQRAHLEEARGDWEAAKAVLARLAELGRAVPASEKAQAEAEVHRKEAQVRIREAELVEAELRVKQAKRRLDEQSKPSAPSKDGERIEELEKKLERLQKEMEALKKRSPGEAKK
jgi:RNA polymerase sigma factor (sigma-70 family)